VPEDLPHPDVSEIDLGAVLAALADPLRRAVVVELAAQEDGFEQNCTAFGLPVTKATRTHHFRVLREAGVIRMRDRGNAALTSLRRDDLQRRFPGLLQAVLADGPPDLTAAGRDGRSRARRPTAPARDPAPHAVGSGG
jgi:DNA-binding transcriptional ArsR family regulator